MGKRGPKPTPTAQLKTRGTHRKHRTKGEPKPKAGIPKCPSWISGKGKYLWREIAPELQSMGVLCEIDRKALEAYCQTYSMWRDAAEDITKNGMVGLTDKEYEYQRPVVGIYNRLLGELNRLRAEFGMTPSSRTRINTADSGESDGDALDALEKEAAEMRETHPEVN